MGAIDTGELLGKGWRFVTYTGKVRIALETFCSPGGHHHEEIGCSARTRAFEHHTNIFCHRLTKAALGRQGPKLVMEAYHAEKQMAYHLHDVQMENGEARTTQGERM